MKDKYSAPQTCMVCFGTDCRLLGSSGAGGGSQSFFKYTGDEDSMGLGNENFTEQDIEGFMYN